MSYRRRPTKDRTNVAQTSYAGMTFTRRLHDVHTTKPDIHTTNVAFTGNREGIRRFSQGEGFSLPRKRRIPNPTCRSAPDQAAAVNLLKAATSARVQPTAVNEQGRRIGEDRPAALPSLCCALRDARAMSLPAGGQTLRRRISNPPLVAMPGIAPARSFIGAAARFLASAVPVTTILTTKRAGIGLP